MDDAEVQITYVSVGVGLRGGAARSIRRKPLADCSSAHTIE
ncbi:MAG: hypothetical protein Q4B57_08345 [Eubacteriales bacterium]|nr:hypothetical protein [Eubacteriales bacterium]